MGWTKAGTFQGQAGPAGPAGATQIAAAQITDATATGVTVLKADQAGARTAIGMGTTLAEVAANTAALASTPINVYVVAGAYNPPTTTRPLIFIGTVNPGGLRDPAKDIWIAT